MNPLPLLLAVFNWAKSMGAGVRLLICIAVGTPKTAALAAILGSAPDLAGHLEANEKLIRTKTKENADSIVENYKTLDTRMDKRGDKVDACLSQNRELISNLTGRVDELSKQVHTLNAGRVISS